jgi:hypothetical protein
LGDVGYQMVDPKFSIITNYFPESINPNPDGWGHISLPKLREGITPKTPYITNNFKSMYPYKKILGVYLIMYFGAKNGVLGIF